MPPHGKLQVGTWGVWPLIASLDNSRELLRDLVPIYPVATIGSLNTGDATLLAEPLEREELYLE